MTNKKSRATQFEAYVKSFMEKLNFADVEGAKDTFRINGIQVDVCGGHENLLIIVDCTMKQELGKKSIRDKIKEFRGTIPTLEKGFKKHDVYRKYKDCRYVIATKNIDIRKEDYLFANEQPRIYLCNDNFFAYYEDLYNKIKAYAKFDLLGEMGIRPVKQNMISVPAFLTTFEKIKMYTFMIDPRDLLEVAYVARRETRNERYYQRIIKKERLDQIAKYINDNNILPNNLIIAFGERTRKDMKFHVETESYMGRCTSGFGVKYGILEFPRDYRSCWIIDGQHRLYSFVKATKVGLNMPVTAFENIGIERQCKIFLDINKNQKPVPPDLVWDLNGDMIPSEEDGIISNVLKALNKTDPLRHKIYIPSSGMKQKTNLLKMAGMCISIKKTRLAKANTISKTANLLCDTDYNKTVKNLSNTLAQYFLCVYKTMKDDWELQNKGFVLDDGGNSVMIRLFEKILSRCVNQGIPNGADYKKYLQPLADLFKTAYKDKDALKKLKLSIASEGGKDEVLKRFIGHIRQETNDNLFGGADFILDIAQQLRDVERKLKEFIKNTLSKAKGNNWFEEMVQKQIVSKAVKNMEKHGETDPQNAYLHIIFGECVSIIRDHKQLFYPLLKKGDYGFSDDGQIESIFDFLSRFKSTYVSHSIGVKKKVYDDEFLDMYIKKVNSCLDAMID